MYLLRLRFYIELYFDIFSELSFMSSMQFVYVVLMDLKWIPSTCRFVYNHICNICINQTVPQLYSHYASDKLRDVCCEYVNNYPSA